MASQQAVLVVTGVVSRAAMVAVCVVLVGMVVVLGLDSVGGIRAVGKVALVALEAVAAMEVVVEMVASIWGLVMCLSTLTTRIRAKHQWFWVLPRA